MCGLNVCGCGLMEECVDVGQRQWEGEEEEGQWKEKRRREERCEDI